MAEQSRRQLRIDEVAERSASGQVAELYHRIRDTLRVGTVGDVWRVLATKPNLLAAMWDELEPAVDEGFHEAADTIRAAALRRVEEAVAGSKPEPPLEPALAIWLRAFASRPAPPPRRGTATPAPLHIRRTCRRIPTWVFRRNADKSAGDGTCRIRRTSGPRDIAARLALSHPGQ